MMNEEKFFEGVASLKFLAKKEVGQNFLIDSLAAKRIVDALEIKEDESVLEIGCGAGSLSYFLVASKGKCQLIDIDEAMIAKVTQDFVDAKNVEILYGNAAKWDYAPYHKIIGNLPYYITSLIIERCLLLEENAAKMVFMVQKEAASRILAPYSSKDYGPLNILLSLWGKTKIALRVGRNSFAPAPHVDSAVMVFDKAMQGEKKEIIAAYHLAESMFLQRRKTIWNNLKNYTHDEAKAKAALEEVGILANARAESLTPTQFLSLSRALNKLQ